MLSKVFPHLSALQLDRCYIHTEDVPGALRSCAHLTHLALKNCQHREPEDLWAAAVAEAEAAGHSDLLQAAAQEPDGLREIQRKEQQGKSAAATGLLLSSLPHLTSLELDMPRALAACRMLVLGDAGSRLTELKLYDSWVTLPFDISETSDLLIPALQACSGLRSLELGGRVGLADVLAACPGLASLRSLSIPRESADQEVLDLVLTGLTGEKMSIKLTGGWMHDCLLVWVCEGACSGSACRLCCQASSRPA